MEESPVPELYMMDAEIMQVGNDDSELIQEIILNVYVSHGILRSFAN